MINLELDTRDILSTLDRLPREFRKTVKRRVLRAGAKVIQKYARRNAPYDRSRKKGTHLRHGIIIEEDRQTGNFIIGTRRRGDKRVPHAHLIEYGTVKMSARPFLAPAAENNKSEIVEVMGRMLDQELSRLL